MELIKNEWTVKDSVEFSNYLKSFSKGYEKGEWEKRILNTSLNCIAVPSNTVNDIVKKILKGNYLSFLNLNLNNNWTEVCINGKIICKIKDFNVMVKYLNNYLLTAESWATIDLLKFKVTSKNANDFLNLIKTYASSDKPFVRRTAIILSFSFINLPVYDNQIKRVIKSLKQETHYYVNMAIAWLTCEYFIKRKELALELLTENYLNDFTKNKAISKCVDSFRISNEDKNYLKLLKRPLKIKR